MKTLCFTSGFENVAPIFGLNFQVFCIEPERQNSKIRKAKNFC